MRLRSLVSLASLSLLLASSACVMFVGEERLVGTVSPRQFPENVRLHLADGTERHLSGARLASDTIRGRDATGADFAIPVEQVATWESKRLSAAHTVMLGAFLVLLGGLIHYLSQPKLDTTPF